MPSPPSDEAESPWSDARASVPTKPVVEVNFQSLLKFEKTQATVIINRLGDIVAASQQFRQLLGLVVVDGALPNICTLLHPGDMSVCPMSKLCGPNRRSSTQFSLRFAKLIDGTHVGYVRLAMVLECAMSDAEGNPTHFQATYLPTAHERSSGPVEASEGALTGPEEVEIVRDTPERLAMMRAENRRIFLANRMKTGGDCSKLCGP
jgi:hypothetical protein